MCTPHHLDRRTKHFSIFSLSDNNSMTVKDATRHPLALGPELFYSTSVVFCGPDSVTEEICACTSSECLLQMIYAVYGRAEMIKMLNERRRKAFCWDE
jgi:hypothetical protein